MQTGISEAIFGQDPKVKKAILSARNVSVTKSPILIVGEVGVGKRSLGTFIHEQSSRRDYPVNVIDCSDSPEDVINQVLGYRDDESGKFHRGILEASNKGTVIFANIDGLDEEFQKRLHQIFNELEDYDIDVRIIATTTKNISKLVGSGRFYRGLYTFIAQSTITIPPLRERLGDLEMLARHFANDVQKFELPVVFEKDAREKILSHYWTHNLRELKTVIQNSVTNAENPNLTEIDLEIGEKKAVSMTKDEENEGIRLMSLKEAEKLLIKKALVHTSENRTQAAKILGVSIRTLRNKINEYRNSGSAYFVNLR